MKRILGWYEGMEITEDVLVLSVESDMYDWTNECLEYFHENGTQNGIEYFLTTEHSIHGMRFSVWKMHEDGTDERLASSDFVAYK